MFCTAATEKVSLLAGLLLLLILLLPLLNLPENVSNSSDIDVTTFTPMWSWDFANHCCEVHPVGERDLTYLRGDITNGSVVYVKVNDLPIFIDKFLALPTSFRLTLVTGMDDFGPIELFLSLIHI